MTLAAGVEAAGGAPEDRPAAGEEGNDEHTWWAPTRRIALAVLAVLSVQFVALCLHQAWNDSLTMDEATYMSTGLASITDGELHLNNEAPFFPKAVQALPLRIAGVEVPLDGAWERTDTIDAASLFGFGEFAGEFVDLHVASGDMQRVAFLGRLVPVLEGLAIGWAIYALAASLFSRGAGLLASGAWMTTPLAVGFSHLNGIDLPFTLAVVVASLALVRHLRSPSWRTLAVLGLAAGSLQLVRHTGVMYVGLICIALVVQRWNDRRAAARDVAVVLASTWVLVWIAVLVVAPTRTPVDQAGVDDFLDPVRAEEQGFVGDVMLGVLEVVPWPAEYEVGFEMQLAFSDGSSPGYLLGDAWHGARPAFWPLSLLIKLPITVVAMLILGPLGWRWVRREDRRQAVLVAVLPTVAAFVFVLQFGRPLGLRYALPGVAMLLVVASPLALGLVRRRAGMIVLGVGVAAQLVFLWSSVPHSLAWTAPPFRPGYQVVSESNLDWGQDGYRLAEWMDGRTVHVAYLGGSDPVGGLPGYQRLDATAPEEVTGWVAVSATLLTTYNRDELAWLRAYCNVGTLGGTILLYRFDEPPSSEPGPTMPAGRCAGSISHRV